MAEDISGGKLRKGDETRRESIFRELTIESDRGSILVGASLLSDRLSDLLRAKFSLDSHAVKHAVEPLLENMGPLTTFSARIKLAYALRLIPEYCFTDLEKIRRIRNLAAHACSSMSFESQEIIGIASTLECANRAVQWIQSEQSNPSSKVPKEAQPNPNSKVSKERMRFILTVSFIWGLIDAQAT